MKKGPQRGTDTEQENPKTQTAGVRLAVQGRPAAACTPGRCPCLASPSINRLGASGLRPTCIYTKNLHSKPSQQQGHASFAFQLNWAEGTKQRLPSRPLTRIWNLWSQRLGSQQLSQRLNPGLSDSKHPGIPSSLRCLCHIFLGCLLSQTRKGAYHVLHPLQVLGRDG